MILSRKAFAPEHEALEGAPPMEAIVPGLESQLALEAPRYLSQKYLYIQAEQLNQDAPKLHTQPLAQVLQLSIRIEDF